MKQEDFDKLQEIGKGAVECIKEMVDALNTEDDGEREGALQAILEDPLSVLVRSDWVGCAEEMKPYEYEILLSTGGPATRIIGELNEHGEPETASIEAQDWFLPWTEYRPDDDSALLDYARCFYFAI